MCACNEILLSPGTTVVNFWVLVDALRGTVTYTSTHKNIEVDTLPLVWRGVVVERLFVLAHPAVLPYL